VEDRAQGPNVVAADRKHPAVEVAALEDDRPHVAGDGVGSGAVGGREGTEVEHDRSTDIGTV
jgi:hypothetical protein